MVPPGDRPAFQSRGSDRRQRVSWDGFPVETTGKQLDKTGFILFKTREYSRKGRQPEGASGCCNMLAMIEELSSPPLRLVPTGTSLRRRCSRREQQVGEFIDGIRFFAQNGYCLPRYPSNIWFPCPV